MPIGVKICGLRDPAQAIACANAGADAIGLVFHPASPRHVSTDGARQIVEALGRQAVCVAVCVDMAPAALLHICERTGIRWVQLHGAETPEAVEKLAREGLFVIKSLRETGAGLQVQADRYDAARALLVECGSGLLPGGNGQAWDWSGARPLAGVRALILAGGLRPENVAAAMHVAAPDAVDVSSGVEQSPGVKAIDRVQSFIRSARTEKPARRLTPIFVPE